MDIQDTSSPILEFAAERKPEKEILRISHEGQALLLANSFSSHWWQLIPSLSPDAISLSQWKKIFHFFMDLMQTHSSNQQLDTIQLKIIVGSYPWYLALQSASLFLKLPTSIPHQSLELIYEENPVNIDIYGKIKLYASIEELTQLKNTILHGYQSILNES